MTELEQIKKLLLQESSNLLKLDKNYDKNITNEILELIKLLINDLKKKNDINDIKNKNYIFRILTDIMMIAHEKTAQEILELDEVQYLLDDHYNDRNTLKKEILELINKYKK